MSSSINKFLSLIYLILLYNDCDFIKMQDSRDIWVWTMIWPLCPRFRMSVCSSGSSMCMFSAGAASEGSHPTRTRTRTRLTHSILILILDPCDWENPESPENPENEPLTISCGLQPGTEALITVRRFHSLYLIHFSLWLCVAMSRSQPNPEQRSNKHDINLCIYTHIYSWNKHASVEAFLKLKIIQLNV